MIRRLAVPISFCLFAGGCAKPAPTRYAGHSCPLPAGAQGYPISARSENTDLTAERLSSVARAVASEWPSSSEPTEEPTTAQLLAELSYQAKSDVYDVYSRRGWRPAIHDTATIALSYAADEPAPAIALQAGRDTTRFQRMALAAVLSARAAAERGKPQRDTFPLQFRDVPAAGAAVVRLQFGSEPGPGDGIARFAVMERDPMPVVATQRVVYPEFERTTDAEGRVMLSIGVRPDGTPDLSTLRVISATSPSFRDAVLKQVVDFRYRPAERDCRPVFVLAQQPFIFVLNRKPTAGR